MREDIHNFKTLSRRTLLGAATDSPIAVITHEAELFPGLRKVIVKQFESHSGDAARKVSNLKLGVTVERLIYT